MNLVSPIPVSERILTYGAAGSGKSFNWKMIADKTDAARFYVIDTDFEAARRMLAYEPQLEGRVEIVDVFEWDDLVPAIQGFTPSLKPHDWVVFDMITPTWDWCQSAYIEKRFGMDAAEYYIEVNKARDEAKKKNEKYDKGPEVNWQIINKSYFKFYNVLLRAGIRANMYATAEQGKLQREGDWADSQDIIDMFGSAGQKPKGQQRLSHLFHTILHMSKNKAGEHYMRTMKDRGDRVDLQREPVKDFAKDYLWTVAGWRPKRRAA